LVFAVTLFPATSCQDEPSQAMRESAGTREAVSASERDEPDPPTRVSIPLGEFQAGTRPGHFQRQPELDPRPFSAKLGPFEIDSDLYPNEAGKPPLLGASREEAGRLCGEAGGRLCTELEWERACRGKNNLPFSTGEKWNDECAPSCANDLRVRSMGTRAEWTASDFLPPSPLAGSPVLRGPADPDTTQADERRCANRHGPAKEGAQTSTAGFRCCYGAPNAVRVVEPSEGNVFEKRAFDGKALEKLLRSNPRTEPLADELSVFGEPEAINTVMDRGPGDTQGFLFTTSPLIWRPATGTEFLVLAAKSGKATSFVLAYHVVARDEFELASSFVMHGEKGPVILAYSPSIRPRLHFSSCWGCPGETGKVLFRPPDSAVVLQP
jgi:formylglycine-generating enzyme required for sulfatase activity